MHVYSYQHQIFKNNFQDHNYIFHTIGRLHDILPNITYMPFITCGSTSPLQYNIKAFNDDLMEKMLNSPLQHSYHKFWANPTIQGIFKIEFVQSC
jgi:hypothetical protein